MKFTVLRRLLAVAAAGTILLSSVTASASEVYPNNDGSQSTLDYSEMDLSDYEYAQFENAIDDLNAAMAVSGNDDAVKAAYEHMLDVIDIATTAASMADIAHNHDVLDEEATELSAQLNDELTLVYDNANYAISCMLETEYEYIIIDEIGEEEADTYRDYEQMTEEQIARSERETELTLQYDELSIDDSLYNDEDAWYSEMCEIYIELVELRKQVAEEEGYDSYMAYAYENIYGRDYSPEESAEYREYVKEYIVPLLDEIINALLDNGYDELCETEAPDSQAILTVMEECLPKISEELMPAFNALSEQHLYDIDADDSKMSVGYTTKLYTYDVPFIFNCPYGDFYDYTTIFHEFGHFNQMYNNPVCAMYDTLCYDVAEIQSQGMELLFLEYADKVYGKGLKDAAALYEMYAMCSAVIEGAMYDEFQQLIYEADELNEEVIDEIFARVAADYGEDYVTKTRWAEIPHNFESPFYYISYSTSAIAALEIYTYSLEDRDAAIDAYLTISAADTSAGFVEVLEDAGLDNAMLERSVKSIAESIKAKTGSAGDYPFGGFGGDDFFSMPSVLIICGIGLLVTLILNAIVVVIVVLCNRTKKTK